MTWAELREKVLAKLYDAMVASGMICATALLGTLAIATPILVLKWLTTQVCN